MAESNFRGIFPTNLIMLRKSKFLSQERFAEEMGVSRGLIGNYEQGTRRPDFELLCLIADYFNVSTDFLLGRSQNPINVTSLSDENHQSLPADQRELLQLYSQLTRLNQGRALERIRILTEEENRQAIIKSAEEKNA